MPINLPDNKATGFVIKDAQSLYLRIRQMVETFPAFASHPVPEDGQLWMGRAELLIAETEGSQVIKPEAQEFRGAASALARGYSTKENAQIMRTILYRALVRAEALAPAGTQSAFLPVGSPFDALAAISKVFKGATHSILVVDPFLGENFMTEFAPLATQGVALQLLTDSATVKPGLVPAYKRWVKQYGGSRPVELRMSPPRALHDRAIQVDGQSIFIVTQSFNGLAVRAPAVVSEAGPEVAQLKIAYYSDAWSNAQPA